MISSNTSGIFIHFTIPSNTVYFEEMAKLERTVDLVDNTKDAKSKVAYLKALVQRAVHRAVGKGKASSKTSTSFPPSVDILTKRECLEQVNVHYSRRGFKACRSSNVVMSTEEQHEKEGSFSITDEAAFDVDVFKLVNIGKWMFEENFEFWDPLEISVPSMRSNYNSNRNHRATQDSLSPEAAKFYFPDGFPEDYKAPIEPVTPMEWPAGNATH
jgi:hypothetical protein